MAIRAALLNDVPSLVEGASRMHALTRFKEQPFSAQRTADSFATIIQQPKGKYAFFIAENQPNKIVGALIGVVEQQIFTEVYSASVMHIDVLPEARMGGYAIRLIRAFELWAKNRNAVEICFGVNSGIETEKVEAMLTKLGYVAVGRNFVLRSVK